MPQFKHGFTDSHFICFPYETRRTGIYTAGPVRRPMDILQAQEDATGAAMKAIQAMENAGLGKAAHPRAGDLSFPTLRKEGCTQCKRCTVECPFGAIDEDEKRFPLFNESRCRRCGTCMGACPVRVISFENYSVNTVGAADQGRRHAGRVLREAAHPDPGLRERRLPGARHGRHEPARVRSLCARHPGALPGFGQHHLDHRCAEQRLRRRHADGLQARATTTSATSSRVPNSAVIVCRRSATR
jgi:ferredoxin